MPSAAAQREQDILVLWDRAAGRARRQRDDALFTAAGAALTDSIGTGNAALLLSFADETVRRCAWRSPRRLPCLPDGL